MYAPPGASAGGADSQVLYSSGSTTGTTNSTSGSFRAGVTVNGSVSAAGLGAGAGFNASLAATGTSQVSISKTTTNQIAVKGPDADGINHGSDLWFLCVNPELTVTVTTDKSFTEVAWVLGVNGQQATILYVYADWLQTPSLMQAASPDTYSTLVDTLGFTQADFDQILATNPFISGTEIDTSRFVLTPYSFPYEGPNAPGDPIPMMTYTQTSQTTVTDTTQVQVQYGVSFTASAGIKGAFTATLSETGTLEITETSTSTEVTGASQSASVTVGGPSYGYPGPTDVQVYWDTVFMSFMFAFATGNPTVVGSLTSAGTNIANQPVSLTMDGTTMSTFTDSAGNYRFFGTAAGEGTISVANETFPVTIAANQPVVPPISVTS